MEGKELQDEENEYLDYIMPTLYKIVTKLQEYVANSTSKFEKIYITGTMSVVNNIDLYFQEFFSTEKCEVLKPYFITENIKINIKDYIEVNSAIAVAMQGLGYGIKSMNFKKPSLYDQLPEWMKIDISLGKKGNKNKKSFNFSLNGKLDTTERWLLRATLGVFMLTILYSVFSVYLNNKINEKIIEAQEVTAYTDLQIQLADVDINNIKQMANRYVEMRNNLLDINQQIQENLNAKNSIPNLLVEIMTITPRNVQITEIENTTRIKDNGEEASHIIIKAQSMYYDDLGYFKAKLAEDNILMEVTSTQGQKQGDFVQIVIEGDLP